MIPSLKPVSRPSIPARGYPDMKIRFFRLATTPDNKVHLTVELRNYDEASDEFDPGGEQITVRVSDLVKLKRRSPKIRRLFRVIDDAVALLYKVKFREDELDEAKLQSLDTTIIEKDLKDAEDDLDAPLNTP